MDSLKASGDNNNSSMCGGEGDRHEKEDTHISESDDPEIKPSEEIPKDITPQMIEDNELKLKDRIAQCRNIIESLKLELSKEKSKLEKETKMPQLPSVSDSMPMYHDHEMKANVDTMDDMCSSNMYSACVDSKLNCDESLIEYEKQLQRYQNTLNMAQIEKKNAIRKQMLAKAYKLKLLEVENQCNIELLRVKQSLQCLEPLQMIANKWKNSPNDSNYDLNNYELIPRYPELNANSGSDINSYREDCDCKPLPDKSGIGCKEDSSSSEY